MPGRDQPVPQARWRAWRRRLGPLPLLLLPCLAMAASPVMYKYLNRDGNPVYSYTLPSEQTRLGYQKIDAVTGQVLETVAPQLTGEELAEKLRRDAALKACREELERIYRLYGSEADIERALQTALSSLETRITQLQTNLRQAEREQERLRSQAADAERTGRQVPARLLDNIERGRSQIATLGREIEQRRAEQVQAKARYARELERFRDGTCPTTATVAEATPAS